LVIEDGTTFSRWKLRHPHSAYGVVTAIAGGRGKPRRAFGARTVFAAATSGDVPLPEREWDHADCQQQKQVKRASNEMRFNGGANVRFHFACAAVRKHLLLDARQRCRDFSLLTHTAATRSVSLCVPMKY
jgi:hypothetical protein